jgi:hypothetical protein
MPQSRDKKPPFVPPRTPAEELITAIYASLLGIELVSISDRFFDLGGNREVAEKLTTRLREIFRVEVTLDEIIASPTVDRLVGTLALKWGGREMVDEIAWTFMQVEQLSDSETDSILRNQGDYELLSMDSANGPSGPQAGASAKKRRLVEALLEKTGITFRSISD